MTPAERKSLAEQLLANPLTAEILDQIERSAVEELVMAGTEQARVEAQWRVRAARSFRNAFTNAAKSSGIKPGSVA